jgi:glycosyltransferase 2 family protein
MRNKVLNTIVMTLSVGIFVSFFVFSNGYNILVKHLKTLDVKWITMALFCMVIFWFLESTILYIVARTIYSIENLFIKSLRFAMIGQFFGAVTPFNSGSQPSQLYAMIEDGIPAGSSGSILMVKFIIHEVILTLFSLLVLIFKFSYFNSRIPHFLYFCIFGFLLNTSIIFFALFFLSSNKLSRKFLDVILKLLNKIRIVKDVEEVHKRFEKELINFHENSVFIAKHMGMCILASVLTFIQWTAYYSIPYFIYRSFGFNETDIITMVAAHVFLTMFMSCIPLPGAEGGAEGGFYLIFGLFFKADTILSAIFIWRIIIYYLSIGVGSIFTLILPHRRLREID